MAAASNDKSAAAGVHQKPGNRMPDRTVFAGVSPDTGKPMYMTSQDAPLTMKWKDAMEYAANLNAQGYRDWRVPTKGELKVLFENRAASGGFDHSGAYHAGWYWSSSQLTNDDAWAKRFSDGNEGYYSLDEVVSSLRRVR